MNTRILFGYLFFSLSVVLTALQFIGFPLLGALEGVQLLLLSLTTLASLLLSFLAVETSRRQSASVLSLVSFAVTFIALAACATFALLDLAGMSAVKYSLLLLYAGFYGAVGLVFSFRARKFGATSGNQDA